MSDSDWLSGYALLIAKWNEQQQIYSRLLTQLDGIEATTADEVKVRKTNLEGPAESMNMAGKAYQTYYLDHMRSLGHDV